MLVFGLALAACGNQSAATSSPTTAASSSPSLTATAAPTTTTLHFAGDRSGDVTDLSATCNQPAGPGGANEVDAIGTLAGQQYWLRIDPAKSLGWSVTVIQSMGNTAQATAGWSQPSMTGVTNFDMAKGATLNVTLQPSGGSASSDLTVSGQVIC